MSIFRRVSVSLNTEFALTLGLIIFTAISVRLAEYPLWLDPAYFVNDEHLMATHDAYTWLAGAKEIGNYIAHPFSQLLAFMHDATGLDLATLGFWSPIILVPLLAVPVSLLARQLGIPEGGLVFGILTTSGLGYLVRTRLGFCDTDLVSLIFPLGITCILAAGLAQKRYEENEPFFLSRYELLGTLAAGIMGKLAVLTYPSNATILFTLYALAVVLGFFIVPKFRREALACAVLLMFALSFSGWSGSLIAGLWIGWRMQRPVDLPATLHWICFSFIFGAVLFLGDIHGVIWLMVQKLFFYAKLTTPELNNATSALKLPEIAQSVREAQKLDWALIGPRMGGNWTIFILGMLGFCLACWRKPALLIFLPFLALGLASMKLGNRFAMYGTVGVGMGLGLGLSEFMTILNQSQGRRWIAQLTMACVALWPSAQFMAEVRPVPVLPKVYAETFVELQELTEPDALLWQWWDYGYAAQYYAERATMGDGSRQTGPWLLPLAMVHCAQDARQAAQLMRYFGQVTVESGSRNQTDRQIALFKGNPVSNLLQMPAQDAKSFLAGLGTSPTSIPTDVSNYFTVSWENLRLAGWISYYGHWDMVAATSQPGKIQQVSGDIRIDSASGGLILQGQTVPLDSLDVIQSDGDRHFTWPNGTGMHAVINQYSRQVFLMDAKMYRSMMIQMLIKPATDFADEFELILDRSPWNRVYKVR
jgi:dolichyl-diphosphooligosaccharide--protein glycosyltransferase